MRPTNNLIKFKLFGSFGKKGFYMNIVFCCSVFYPLFNKVYWMIAMFKHLFVKETVNWLIKESALLD